MDEISSHAAYQRSFRLFQIRLVIVIVSIISIIIGVLLCVCTCACFNLLSDNQSNTIRVIWYFVMLYNGLVSFQP